MLPISRILAPVDLSDRSLGIIPYVKQIAARYGAEVTLLHVVNPFITVPPTGLSGPTLIPVAADEVEVRTRQLNDFAAAELRGINVKRVVYEGDPASQIVGIASQGTDLIVLPTHGYGPVREFLLGSVAAKVLHDVACPVFTAKHPDGNARQENQEHGHSRELGRVLCAVNLGADSERILQWASSFAADVNAQFGIAHAITAPDPGIALLLNPDFGVKLAEVVRGKIEELQRAAEVEAAGIYTAQGDVAQTLSELAESAGADLLVIGRGTSAPDDGRLGANAYSILRHSRCPVISI